LPLSYGIDRPDQWYGVPDDRREEDILLSSDQCVIAARFFFVRGNIEIPIIGTDEKFSWDVWTSLSKENFERSHELWEVNGRENMIQPMFGWLCNSIPTYRETLNLKTLVHTRPVGARPLIELEPTGHPLAQEQRNGITHERLCEIAASLFHVQPARREG
jgi:hypothetical protein